MRETDAHIKGQKIFHIKETNGIIVIPDKGAWWDNFNMGNFAKYVRSKFLYNLKKINQN